MEIQYGIQSDSVFWFNDLWAYATGRDTARGLVSAEGGGSADNRAPCILKEERNNQKGRK